MQLVVGQIVCEMTGPRRDDHPVDHVGAPAAMGGDDVGQRQRRIGHSSGGVIARWVLQNCGEMDVDADMDAGVGPRVEQELDVDSSRSDSRSDSYCRSDSRREWQ